MFFDLLFEEVAHIFLFIFVFNIIHQQLLPPLFGYLHHHRVISDGASHIIPDLKVYRFHILLVLNSFRVNDCDQAANTNDDHTESFSTLDFNWISFAVDTHENVRSTPAVFVNLGVEVASVEHQEIAVMLTLALLVPVLSELYLIEVLIARVHRDVMVVSAITVTNTFVATFSRIIYGVNVD